MTAVASTVLYVEDNPTNVRLVERIVSRRAGVTLIVASQGQPALQLAREHRPDLILLDLHLPDMTGEDVLGRLQADPDTAGIPVVILSADASPDLVERLRAHGATEYLTKPFAVADLLALIDGIAPQQLPVSPPPGSPELVDRPALDPHVVATLRQLADGAHGGFLAELITTYLDHATSELAALRDALANNDLTTVRELAHSLRGASANIGASAVALRAGELEHAATSGTAAEVTVLAARLANAFEDAERVMRVEFLDSEPPDGPHASP